MQSELPTEQDFLEDHGCLDAQHAWKEFGGLTLDEAYIKFCENPVYFGEDFRFMGEMAFAYYFDVLDRYIRDAIEKVEEDAFDEFGRICSVIYFHFDNPETNRRIATRYRKRDKGDAGHLRDQVAALCDYVIDQVPKLCIGSHPHSSLGSDELLTVWSGLQKKVEAP